MRPWAVIALKEIREQLRSRKTLFTIIITPALVWLAVGFMHAVLFGAMVPGGPMTQPMDMHLTVEDEGELGQLARQVIYAVAANMNVVVHEVPAPEGEELVREGDTVLYVRVPANFTEALVQQGVGTVEVWVDPTSVRARAVAAAIEGALRSTFEQRLRTLQVRERLIRHVPFALLMLSFMLVMSAMYGPMPVITTSFAGEREKKTLEVLLVTPVKRTSILLGKLLAAGFAAAIYLASNAVGLAAYNAIVAWALAGAGVGEVGGGAPALSPEQALLVIGAAALTVLLSSSLGVVISCFAKSVKDAETYYSTIFMVPIMMLAGTFAMRFEELPLAMRLVLLAVPFTHAMLMINNVVIYGRPWHTALLNALYMLAWAVGALLAGAKLFEREEIVETRKVRRARRRLSLGLRFLGRRR